VDALGGALAAIEQGFQEAAIEEEAYRWQRAVDQGERLVVGVNCFRSASTSTSMSVLHVDAQLEGQRLAAVKARKQARTAQQVTALTAALEAAVRQGRNVVASLIPAAEGGLTIGEMAATLSRIFGEHRE
jgi:methylmalonyl-CoA mutase N-terminal domain/subunit